MRSTVLAIPGPICQKPSPACAVPLSPNGSGGPGRSGHRTGRARRAAALDRDIRALPARGSARGADLPGECRDGTAGLRDRASAFVSARDLFAALVARGLPNREVAAELYISTKTVQYHLTRIHTELGIRSRAGLAALREDI